MSRRLKNHDPKRMAARSLTRGKRALILGSGEQARNLAAVYQRCLKKTCLICGVVTEQKTPIKRAHFSGLPMLGSILDLDTIVTAVKPDFIILATSEEEGEIPERLLALLLRSVISLRPAIEVYEEMTGKLPIDLLSGRHFLHGTGFRPESRATALNRLMSLLVAGAAIVVSAPFMAIIAAAIKIDSPGSVFFIQDRAGLLGRRFGLCKFRTMRVDIAQHSVWAADNADRVTGVGRWLRKFRLDELPQLINVFRGDMNLVGPRPHPSPSCEMIALISRNLCESGTVIPYYSMRSLVRPGITGWAQVRYKYANGLGEELEKLRYDLYYVKHYSIWLDLRIMLMTIPVIFRGRGSGEEQSPEASSPEGESPRASCDLNMAQGPNGERIAAELETATEPMVLVARNNLHSGWRS